MQHERATSLELALAHTKKAISKTWAADGRFAGFADSNAETMASSSLPSSLSIPCALTPARLAAGAGASASEPKGSCSLSSLAAQSAARQPWRTRSELRVWPGEK